MKKTIKNSMALLALMSLASCGGSKSASDSKEQQPLHLSPTEIALKNFESWKKSKFKYCDMSDAFGFNYMERTELPNIDVNQLFISNNNSAIFSNGTEFVEIASFTNVPGGSYEFGGGELDAKVERKDSLCTVTIGGEEVFKSQLALKVNISKHWGDKKSVTKTSTEEAIKNSLKASEATIVLLGKILNLKKEDSQQYFKAINTNNELIYRVSEKTPWNSLYSNMPEDYSIEVRTPSAKFMNLDGKQFNFKDSGNLVFKYKLKSGIDSEIEFSEYLGTRPHNIDEAMNCLKMMDLKKVTYEVLFKRCEMLEPRAKAIAFENGVMKELTMKYFGYKSLDTFSETYSSFKDALKILVKEQLLSENAIQDLDPRFKTEVIPLIINNLRTVDEATQNNPSLLEVKDSLIEIALEWAFWNPLVIGTDINELLSVAKDFRTSFKGSVDTIISTLGKKPKDKSAIGDLVFASNIEDKTYYKEKVKHYLSIYTRHTDILNNIFQRRVTTADITDWMD